MLVLSRKQGESIEFSGLDVVVRVISLKRSKVQLGIEAPRQITVHRSEKVVESQRDDATADQQLLDELARVESELAALAELAASKDRLAARGVAADAIQRVEAVKRSIRLATRHQTDPRPLSDFLKPPAELPEQPASQPAGPQAISWPTISPDRPNQVRQTPSTYAIEKLRRCAS